MPLVELFAVRYGLSADVRELDPWRLSSFAVFLAAEGRVAAQTIEGYVRRLAGLARMQAELDGAVAPAQASMVQHAAVKAVLAGIKRQRGVAPQPKAPFPVEWVVQAAQLLSIASSNTGLVLFAAILFGSLGFLRKSNIAVD